MLGEARMKKPREMRPVSDLADMGGRIFEVEDYLYGSDDGLTIDHSTNKSTSDVAENNGSTVDSQKVSSSVVTKSRAELNPTASVSKSDKSNNNHVPKRAKPSKGDLPGPSTRVTQKTQSKEVPKEGKFSRPPQEYLKQNKR